MLLALILKANHSLGPSCPSPGGVAVHLQVLYSVHVLINIICNKDAHLGVSSECSHGCFIGHLSTRVGFSLFKVQTIPMPLRATQESCLILSIND